MDILVSTDWLAQRLDEEAIVVLDASRHLPAAGRDPMSEFETAHIPGARFLDLASLSDKQSPVPSALPSAAQLAERLAQLGVRSGDTIVLYDDSAVKTSARAWFALKAHGLDKVAILDGGFGKWQAEARPIESGIPAPAPANPMALRDAIDVRFKSDMLANLESGTEQVIDARGADRVFGTGIDPVHGGQNGRIPGSLNLPFGKVFDEDGTFLPPDQIKAAFAHAGMDFGAPVVATCGSGVTASVLLFALALIGKQDAALYDGSWQEWEADPDTPKAQGNA